MHSLHTAQTVALVSFLRPKFTVQVWLTDENCTLANLSTATTIVPMFRKCCLVVCNVNVSSVTWEREPDCHIPAHRCGSEIRTPSVCHPIRRARKLLFLGRVSIWWRAIRTSAVVCQQLKLYVLFVKH